MEKEDKQLLLTDLCARLPYEVKVQDELGRTNKLVIGNADLVRLYYDDFTIYNEHWLSLPCLRSMSSITDKEKSELRQWGCLCMTKDDIVEDIGVYGSIHSVPVIDWLNAHHFDYRGLISKGLAIEVTRENNPYK